MGGSNSVLQSSPDSKSLSLSDNFSISSQFSLKSTSSNCSSFPSELFKGSKLFEAMELINRYPILCTAFYRFFRSGRWIHQFLSSNPNLSSWSSLTAQSNLVNQLLICDISASLLSSMKDTKEGFVAMFLACSFPIFMQSSEFQLWLENHDTNEIALEKEVINIDTMDFRRSDQVQDFVADFSDSDDEDTVDTRPIYATCVNSTVSPNLKMRHRRKSHVSSDPFFIRADTGRMRAMVDEVLSTVTKEQLEKFHQPSHWMSQIESLLSALPFPVLIASSKTNARGLVPGLYSESVRIVAVNEMYGSTFGKKPAQMVGRSFQDAIFKDHRVASKEILVEIDGETEVIAEESMKGLYPMKLQLESKSKGDTASSALFIKPVHHVLADPEYNYVIAVHYDMSNSPATMVDSFIPVSTKFSSSKKTDVSSAKSNLTKSTSSVGTLNKSVSFSGAPALSLSPSFKSTTSSSSQRHMFASSSSTLLSESSACPLVPESTSSCFPGNTLVDLLYGANSSSDKVVETIKPVTRRGSVASISSSSFMVSRATRQYEKDMLLIEDVLNLLPCILY